MRELARGASSGVWLVICESTVGSQQAMARHQTQRACTMRGMRRAYNVCADLVVTVRVVERGGCFRRKLVFEVEVVYTTPPRGRHEDCSCA